MFVYHSKVISPENLSTNECSKKTAFLWQLIIINKLGIFLSDQNNHVKNIANSNLICAGDGPWYKISTQMLLLISTVNSWVLNNNQ